MEIRQIQAFLAVAEELHFGRAAERLHIAQPPLSQTIRSLERELGVDLFARTTRSVRLTAAGSALLAPARIIETQVKACRTVTQAASLGQTGVVGIGFGGAGGYAVLSGLTNAVAEAFPGIALELRPQTYSGAAIELIRSGALDLGIVALPVGGDLTTLTVRRETLLAALPAQHRLAGAERIALHELGSEPFVMYPSAHGSRVRDATIALCAQAGITPRTVHEAPDPYSLLALVGAGLGVAVVVDSTTHVRVDGVVYRPIEDEVPALEIAMAWRADNPNPAAHRVVDVLRGMDLPQVHA
ncbi:LysR family transcriptional regulator [Rhodococcus phenolicus]|uniref:LysR family transcriptional regulator n=1 Tax=Rhodococcus phenolicus TaxID=263849 RepID=UPI00082E9BAB|nr:LysR family transcriptional regulator [Rhodococcus phenolicus]